MTNLEDTSAIRIRLASPEQIRSWSSGEVLRPDTLNFRTLKPEKDGLFCERIFGPVKDWSCACGRYRKARNAPLVCERCGVEVGPSTLRRERMGHIELAAPVAHPWYANGVPNRMALLLGISPRQLKDVLSCSLFIVTDVCTRALSDAPGLLRKEIARRIARGDPEADLLPLQECLRLLPDLRLFDLLDDVQVSLLSEHAPGTAKAGTGAEALRCCLSGLDLDGLASELRCVLAGGEAPARKRAARRLEVVEALRASGVQPAWMILTVLPVLPPELRPMVPLEGGRYATTDVNDLYCRVIHRNNRIRRLREKGAPQLILRHEQRLLQAAVDALFDNAHRKRPILGPTRQPLKSLSDALSGKGGRFRRNLLGKRVDYSGRSVITAGLHLQLHQCGLPKAIALELFKPFVMRKLVDRHFCPTVRSAKRLVERGTRAPDVVWDQLSEVMLERPVLLNRAPTLHRLSLQAFEPVLVEGSAIQLHPLVCSAYNADFDGDQMAVHLPLSDAASREAYLLMLSTRTLRSPATGEPAVAPTQEMVLGCYYLTEVRPGQRGEGRRFSDAVEARLAYEHGVVGLQAQVRVRLPGVSTLFDAPPPAPPRQLARGELVETTVGRLIFNEALPARLGYRNYATRKEHLKSLVGESLAAFGPSRTAQVADDLKRLGFSYATKSGISFATSDISVPPEKNALVEAADAQAGEIEDLVRAGMITAGERDQQLIELWTKTTDEISKLLEARLDPWGTLATIIKSGATKAKFQQIRQLSGMRGLMASPSGEIIPLPVRGNYLEGLRVWELFIAASGARKGFMDRSLNTANSGYRTLILVEVGREVAVTEEDCGDGEGILVTGEESRALGLPSLAARITSRVLAQPVAAAGVNLPAGTLLTDECCAELVAAGVDAARVRSPLTCQAPRGVCRRCYGADLATGQLVAAGAAVGVIAAQSIGEPGTQLTMRTFHSGGVAFAQGDITQGLPRINELFEVHTPPAPAVLSEIDGLVELDQAAPAAAATVRVVCRHALQDDYPLPPGARLAVAAGERVRAGQVLAHPAQGGGAPCVARIDGVVGLSAGLLCLHAEEREERSYSIPPRRKLLVADGQAVTAGTPLCQGPLNPQEVLRTLGRAEAALYLVREVQAVYRTTGVYLHDKHTEIFVRQMLRWVVVEDAGDTALIPGQIVDRFRCCDVNAAVLAQGGRPAIARPVLLGTIRVALNNESWLAQASFQQTVRVLSQAALAGKTDRLLGSKQAIILGKRLPGA